MSVEDRLAALEKRVQAAEDQLEIIRLISGYAPAVDSGENERAAGLWIEDGVYDVGGYSRWVGRDEIAARIDAKRYPAIMNRGQGHILTTPRISVSGDTAEVFLYSFVITKKDNEDIWEIDRAAANHMTLTRTPEGWRVKERYNRLVNGSKDTHDALRRALR